MLDRREKNRHVRLGTAVRLNIGVLRTEKLFRSVDRRLLGDIRKLAAAVITLARIALGILVRKNSAHRLEHRLRDKILRSNKLKPIDLPPNFRINGIADQRISFRDRR